MRRTIEKPMGLDQPVYFRLKISELTDNGWKARGFHNQPFATRDAAEAGATELQKRISRTGHFAAVEIVKVQS